MSKIDKSLKAIIKAIESHPKDVEKILNLVDSPEVSTALTGKAKEAYLNALDKTYGPAEKRATDLGFSPDTYYHGTNASSIESFNPELQSDKSWLGKGTYVSNNPDDAAGYSSVTHPDNEKKYRAIFEQLKKEYLKEGGNPSDSEKMLHLWKEAQKKFSGGLDDKGVVYPLKIKNPNPEILNKRLTFENLSEAENFAKDKEVALMRPKTQWPNMVNVTEDTIHARVSNPADIRSTNAAFDPRFKDSAKILAGAAAMPATSGISPIPAIKEGVDWYHQNVSEPLKKAFQNQVDLTRDKSMAKDPVFDTLTGAMTDPVNYVPGAAGAGLGAIEAVSGFAEGGAVSGAEVYDISGEEPQLGELPHEQVQDAIASGQFSFPKGKMISVYNPEGELGELPAEEAPEAFKAGFKYALPGEVREETYGTLEQQAKTAVEGAAEGVLGPIAPAIQTGLGISTPEDMLARREENPITFGAGQAAGLVGSTIAGTGAGAIMTKVGAKAAEAVGLADAAAQGMSFGAKVGSSAVTQAAEMAVLASSDEVSKAILQDPNQSVESAIANIGLASALGGAGGALFTGAVSPLWEVSAGPKVDQMLNGLKSHFNGNAALLPEELKVAKAVMGGTGVNHNEVTADVFANKIQEIIKDKNPMYKANITPYTAEEYAGFKTYLSPDGKSGFAIKPDGELISVFSKAKGRGESLVDDAVLNKGAVKLDAFDINGKLPSLYGKYMDETSRFKFADEYAPKDWDYAKLGRPDVVMMGLNPEKAALHKGALDFPIPPEIQAVLSGNPTAISHYNVLKEGQHAKFGQTLEKFHNDLSDSVSKSLRVAPEDLAVYSENEAGHDLLNTFRREYSEKYGPVAEALEKRNAISADILIPDEARLAKYGEILEAGMNKVGTDSPAYKLYNEYGNRLLAKETVGAMDVLKTEINGEIEKAIRAADVNTATALKDIRSSIAEFQEREIEKQAYTISKDYGMKGAEEVLAERAAANKGYKEFASMSSELSDHLGVGSFKGAGTLTNKLTDKVSAEQLLNKFSIKGNADFIPFLQKNFPEVYAKVQENELKRLLKPAALSAKGEQPLNIKKLSDIIEKGMSGQKEYIEAIIPPEALQRITAAKQLTDALPNVKSSGTAGWMTKMFSDMPRSAMAAVAMLTGHNPLIGAILGEMAQRMGRDAPDAIRLAHLKFLASDQPVKASGFKAMVDFFHDNYKAEANLNKAVKNIFQRGAQVLAESQIPNQKDRDKLDKTVTKMQEDPTKFMRDQASSQLGYYLPNHQIAATRSITQAQQYLQSIKPREHILGPLDKPVPPQPVEIARYNRALDIAQQPNIVLQRIKDGTLQKSDLVDLNAMYPALYSKMAKKVSSQLTIAHGDGEPVPYKTRLAMALFLGTPVDKTMEPMSIIAAQPMPKEPQQGGQPQGKTRKGTTNLGKSNKSYMTPSQSGEASKSNRD
jgi:hypothetical protein